MAIKYAPIDFMAHEIAFMAYEIAMEVTDLPFMGHQNALMAMKSQRY